MRSGHPIYRPVRVTHRVKQTPSEPCPQIDLISKDPHTATMKQTTQPKRRWFQFRLRTLLIAVFVLSVLLSTLAAMRAAWMRTFEYKLSQHAQRIAEGLRESIQNEIQTLGNHEWAGVYYHGDGLGVNVVLMLAPESGCLFEWHGCMGLYDRNFGSVTQNKDGLRLSLRLPNDHEGLGGIAEELIPVAWQGRRYLIPPDDFINFCNEVNDGLEPRKGVHGLHLLRRGDEQVEAEGLPTVPEKYRPYLLTDPIEAEIIRVGACTSDSDYKNTPVTLNRGKNVGLLKE